MLQDIRDKPSKPSSLTKLVFFLSKPLTLFPDFLWQPSWVWPLHSWPPCPSKAGGQLEHLQCYVCAGCSGNKILIDLIFLMTFLALLEVKFFSAEWLFCFGCSGNQILIDFLFLMTFLALVEVKFFSAEW